MTLSLWERRTLHPLLHVLFRPYNSCTIRRKQSDKIWFTFLINNSCRCRKPSFKINWKSTIYFDICWFISFDFNCDHVLISYSSFQVQLYSVWFICGRLGSDEFCEAITVHNKNCIKFWYHWFIMLATFVFNNEIPAFLKFLYLLIFIGGIFFCLTQLRMLSALKRNIL